MCGLSFETLLFTVVLMETQFYSRVKIVTQTDFVSDYVFVLGQYEMLSMGTVFLHLFSNFYMNDFLI